MDYVTTVSVEKLSGSADGVGEEVRDNFSATLAHRHSWLKMLRHTYKYAELAAGALWNSADGS